MLNHGSASKIEVEGSVAHDAPASANPVPIGGLGSTAPPDEVDANDLVAAYFSRRGRLGVFLSGDTAGANVDFDSEYGDADDTSLNSLFMTSRLQALAPDGAVDALRTAGNVAPGLGALNVAPIGGDLALRASAVVGEANGQSTALANLGWVKSFSARLDVTAVPTGGSPTLDVFIQTQNASGDWQDIVGFTRVMGSVAVENVAWGSGDGNISGIGAESAAVTFDRFFADSDVGMADAEIRIMPLGDSMRVKWVFAAGGSTGDYTFAVDTTFHS